MKNRGGGETSTKGGLLLGKKGRSVERKNGGRKKKTQMGHNALRKKIQ